MPALVAEVIRAILISTAGSVAVSAGYSMAKDFTDVAADEFNVYMTQTVPNLVSDIANSALGDSGLEATGVYDPVTGNTNYTFVASSSLTGDEAELVGLVAEKLNNSSATSDSVIGAAGGAFFYDDGMVTPATYSWMKTCIGNAVAEFSYNKYKQFAMEQGIALENNGAVPVYDFNFVGPIPSIDMPEHYTMVNEYMLDGITFTRPVPKDEIDPAYCKTVGFDGWGVRTNVGYNCGGCYLIYDGDIYFNRVCETADDDGKMIAPTNGRSGGVTQYVRSDGVTFHETSGLAWVPKDIPMGFYLSNRADLESNSLPSLSAPAKLNDNSFTVTSDGIAVDVPRTDEEQAIADGINLGLVDEDGNLILDENGNIVSIDGLNIDKLMQLIQQIADNGSISFDSVEEYLAEISRLLRLANVDSAAMNTVIANLKELEKAQSKDISDINENVAAIAEALTAAKEANLDFEIPEASIFDKFPFSLPWDFYNVISLLCTEEKAPVFTVPIETNLQFGSLDYEVDEEIVLDLTVFKLNGYDVVQIFTSTTSYLFFIVCLIGSTKKLLWK